MKGFQCSTVIKWIYPGGSTSVTLGNSIKSRADLEA